MEYSNAHVAIRRFGREDRARQGRIPKRSDSGFGPRCRRISQRLIKLPLNGLVGYLHAEPEAEDLRKSKPMITGNSIDLVVPN